MTQGRRTLDEIREDVLKLQNELSEVKAKLNQCQKQLGGIGERTNEFQKKTRWLKNPNHWINVVTLLAIILGAIFQMWINRPVVDYGLGGGDETFRLVKLNWYNFTTHRAQSSLVYSIGSLYVQMQNTGQTDISLNITVVAVNATLSTNSHGPFTDRITVRWFLQAKTSWSSMYFDLKLQSGVDSFKVLLMTPMLVDSPDGVTTLVDHFTTYNQVYPIQFTWVKTNSTIPGTPPSYNPS